MESAAHTFTKTVACPCCKDTFKHLFALAAHVESADKKCTLKHSDIFEIFLGQLTWNLVEVTGEHKSDGTTKFSISKNDEEDYGVVSPAQRQLTFGHYQVHGSRPSDDLPELTMSALSSLEKQPEKPLSQFKTTQQQVPPRNQPQQSQQQIQRGQPQSQAQVPVQARSQTQYQQRLSSLQQRPEDQAQAPYRIQPQQQQQKFP